MAQNIAHNEHKHFAAWTPTPAQLTTLTIVGVVAVVVFMVWLLATLLGLDLPFFGGGAS